MCLETVNTKILAGGRVLLSKLKYFALCMGIVMGFASVFGFGNIYIGVSLATALLTYRHIDLGFSPKHAAPCLLGLFLLTGLASWANGLGVWISVPINFLTVYILTSCTATRLEQKAYIPLVLCFIFVQGNPVAGSANLLRMLGFLFTGTLAALCYYLFHRRQPQALTMKEVAENALRFSERTQFSLRMAAALTAAMLIGGLLHCDRPMWLGIVTFAMTRPLFSETVSRIKHRTFGCALGVLCFVLLHKYLIDPRYSAVLLMACGFLSSVPGRYGFQQIFVTVNALGAAALLLGGTQSVTLRLLFLAGGIAIALVCYFAMEKLIFPLARLHRHQDAPA